MEKTLKRQAAPTSEPWEEPRSGVAIVGVGAVGSSLARSLFRSGYRVLALINRTLEPAAALASQTGAKLASTDVADIPADASLVFVCTPDNAIARVAASIAATELELRRTVVAHASGRRTSEELAPVRARGARVLSFHPLGSFPPGNENKTFQGLTIGLEGDPLAVAIGRALALDLGAFPVEIPMAAKPTYHLAAAMTSNLLVTLMSDVEHILGSAGLPLKLTQSLAADTLNNLAYMPPERALTGPIARADQEALISQIELIGGMAPELLSRFLTLASGAVELAHRSGRITDDQRAKLQGILDDRVRP